MYRVMYRFVSMALIAAFALLGGSGCTSQAQRLKTFEESTAFMDPGATTRQDIVEWAGKPATSYEDGRLIIYYVGSIKGDFEVSRNPRTSGPEYHLVIEFDEAGLLRRRKLVTPP